MKRKLSTIAILGLVLSGLSASPAQATPINGVFNCVTGANASGTFTVTNDIVVSQSNCAGHAEIPAGVTSVGTHGFFLANSLTSVSIPNSVTLIGTFAFRGTGLRSVTIPNSVTTIALQAFSRTSSLTSIEIPDSVTSLGEAAFQESGLISITIPNSISRIPTQFLEAATALTSITIPSSVTSIGNLSFGGATSLTSITVPNSVTSIEMNAFQSSGLTSATFLGSAPTVGSDAFANLPAGSRALVSRAHIGSGAGKYGNVGDNWNGLRVSLPSATLSLNSEGVITTQSVEETVAPTSPQLSRAGFTLQGWSATQGGAAAFAADLSDFTMGPAATSLFAVWSPLPATQEETPAFQFSGPLLSGFDKRSIAQDAPTSITFRGKRMNQVLSVTVDEVAVAIESSSRSQLTIAIGAMKPGTYTLVLQSRSGSMTLSRFLVVR